jgi:hypothetical protein
MDVLDYIFINGERKEKPLPSYDTKTDANGYFKAPSGAVISKDNESLLAYKKQKSEKLRLNRLEEEVTAMKNDIAEIKALLITALKEE